MRKLKAIGLVLPALVCFTNVSVAQANQAGSAEDKRLVEITWQDPKSYTDVRPGNETRSGFRKRVFKSLDAYFNELAEQLPENQSLEIIVTDLDLAGQVWPTMRGGASDIRIIDRVYIPRMTFSYELKDGDAIIQSAEVDLKEMAFMNRISTAHSNDPFRYEKEMIKRWFNDEFTATLAKN